MVSLTNDLLTVRCYEDYVQVQNPLIKIIRCALSQSSSLNRVPPHPGGIICQMCMDKRWGSPSKASPVKQLCGSISLRHNQQIRINTSDVYSFSPMSVTALQRVPVGGRTADSMRVCGSPVMCHLRRMDTKAERIQPSNYQTGP